MPTAQSTEFCPVNAARSYELAYDAIRDLRYYADAPGRLEQLWSDVDATLPEKMKQAERQETLAKTMKDVCWGTVNHWVYSRMLGKMAAHIGDTQLTSTRMPRNGVSQEIPVGSLSVFKEDPMDDSFFRNNSTATSIDGIQDTIQAQLRPDDCRPAFTPNEQKFVNIGMRWILGESLRAWTEVQADPVHPYRSLYSELAQRESDQLDATLAIDESKLARRKRFLPTGDVTALNIEGAYDNLSTTLMILEKLRIQLEQRNACRPLYDLRRTALNNIDRLGHLSTVAYPIFQEAIDADEPLKEINLGTVYPIHRTLAKGLWRAPQRCPAVYDVLPPTEDERRSVQSFFSTPVVSSIVRDWNTNASQKIEQAAQTGEFSLVTAILALGILLVEETAWHDDYSNYGDQSNRFLRICGGPPT